MMKTLVFLSILGFMGSSALAIENLGPSCEFHLRSSPRYSIAENMQIDLQPTDILIRGHLEAYWERGMDEDQTRWSIRDEDYDKKILASYQESLHALRNGDRLYLIASTGNLMHWGVYRERKVHRYEITSRGTVDRYPNVPGLYKAISDQTPIVGSKRLTELFRGGAKAVVVRNLSAPAKAKLVEKMTPKLMRHYAHMLSPRRYYKVNPNLTLEIAFFEETHDGAFGFETVQVQYNRYNPKTGVFEMLDPELALKPFLKMGPTEMRFDLRAGDELLLLDLLGGEIGRLKMNSDTTTGTNRAGERFEELHKKFKMAQRAVVIRNKSPITE